MARIAGYRPDQCTPLVIDKWRSDTLLLKLKSGCIYTGYFQWWDDEGPNTWNLNNRDATDVDPQDIEWWVNAADVAQLVEVKQCEF